MRVLLLEDDIDLGQAVDDHLEAAGHSVYWCKLVSQVRNVTFDLALVDLNLPDGDGVDLVRYWRQAGRLTPVIMLTARDQVSDRIRGLQAGADDYLVKPFDLDEMLARIDAVLRRSSPSPRLQVHDNVVDLEQRQVLHQGQPLDLTAMEWAVLRCLASRPGRIFNRGEIDVALAADGQPSSDSNTLEVIVSRLRKKLGADVISTHRGMGYRLDV
ncbi:two component transcriptional regulator, winged helix family [Leptothrix cholodnii SP-6]|uniref:Two component transcriptional regulator, winged helix family n=1 Tax=Leptothrix cholodnii (strain ATCC 51168 / LMG 8142 / SP-6) TaxID=395495 RepID=B1Y345_LEPCP|nr:response regulator transcription factor [Leptothrix cholodnii]ACB35701.1 two component transcriptional regulator, winged helix family [Leptothrix cholodnii SP-6]